MLSQNKIPTLLALTLLASACSNISPANPTSRNKQTSEFNGTAMTQQLDALAPGEVPISGADDEKERQPPAGTEQGSKKEPVSTSNEINPSQEENSEEFNFEEEPKRKEIEIPVVNLSESDGSEKPEAESKGSSCASLPGIAGTWAVGAENSLVRSTSLILLQDFDGIKTYSASTTSQKAISSEDSENTISYSEMESATVRFDTGTCRITFQKDLEETTSTFLVSEVKSSGAQFTMKKCLDAECKSTGESVSYLKR
ncbi:MAG: hypothetical protein KGP28_09880 [Bdellovibrionales bacterium]|nr:hypothetical protein [Bdellovibrionales bacterium]